MVISIGLEEKDNKIIKICWNELDEYWAQRYEADYGSYFSKTSAVIRA